jgi:hypothetical protein
MEAALEVRVAVEMDKLQVIRLERQMEFMEQVAVAVEEYLKEKPVVMVLSSFIILGYRVSKNIL